MKKRAKQATTLVHSVNAQFLFGSVIFESLAIVCYIFEMREFEISFSELSVECYVAFLLQLVSWCAFAGLYWSAGWYHRFVVSETGIQQARFFKTVKEIRWQDVQEAGIKWRLMDCGSRSAWAWGGNHKCCGYYIYFSDHTLSVEERTLLGSCCRKKAAPPGVIYYADMTYRTSYQISESKTVLNPLMANAIAAYFPAFLDLCAAFEVDDQIGKCIYTTPSGVFQKTDLLQNPIGAQQFKREKRLVSIAAIACFVMLAIVVAILAYQGSRG